MRKGITTVFILLFTLFAGSVLAGDKSDCDHFKKDPTYKGAYGLCVAYQNADESDQSDIFDNWLKKFGQDAPVLPNSPNDVTASNPIPVTCPCWDADSVASWTEGLYAFSCENPEFSEYGEVVYSSTLVFGDNSLVLIAGDTWITPVGSSECAIFTQLGLEAMIPVTEAEADECNAVISGLILVDEFIEDCLVPTD